MLCKRLSFFFYSSDDHRDLHSFPTRRSSDLGNVSNGNGLTQLRLIVPIINARQDITSFEINRLRLRRSEEHTSELQSRQYLVCRLLLEKKKNNNNYLTHSDTHTRETRQYIRV